MNLVILKFPRERTVQYSTRDRSHKGFGKLSTTNRFAYSAVGGFVYPDGVLKSFLSKRIIKIVLGTGFLYFYFFGRPSGYLR